MEKRYYVFEEDGPYKWQRARHSTGPYYNETNYFEDCYDSESDANKAIENAIKAGSWGPFFILPGFYRK